MEPRRERGCSWAAFIAAVVMLAAFGLTWGFSLLLAPVPITLSIVAWFRSPRDGLFWTGVGLNGLLLSGFTKKLGELTWF